MHSEENLNSEFQTKKDLPKFHSSSVTYKDIYTGKYKNDHWAYRIYSNVSRGL